MCCVDAVCEHIINIIISRRVAHNNSPFAYIYSKQTASDICKDIELIIEINTIAVSVSSDTILTTHFYHMTSFMIV